MKRFISLLVLIPLFVSGFIIESYADDEQSHIHTWSEVIIEEESTCITHGSGYKECTECGETEEVELPLVSHEWSDWETTKAATVYKSGKKYRYCYYCDKEQFKTIPKKTITKNQKKAINTVKIYLKAAKSYNVKKMNSCFKKKSKKYGYPTKNVNWAYKKYNKKMKWTIVDATGKGNTIKVKAKVTVPDLYEPTYKAMYETLDWLLIHPKASSKKIGNIFVKKYNKKVKKSKVKMFTDTYTFTVVKTKKGWKIKSKSRTIVDLATGFYNEAMDDASDDFIDYYS